MTVHPVRLYCPSCLTEWVPASPYAYWCQHCLDTTGQAVRGRSLDTEPSA